MLQKRFDHIIACIEEFIEFNVPDVPQELAAETGLNLRMLGDAFLFITDMTLVKYIRQRRLIHALKKHFDKNLSFEQIAEESGYSDAAAFSKSCKNEFGLSPTDISEAFLDNCKALSFAGIAKGIDLSYMENNTMNINSQADTICGISAEQFAEVKRILEIGALYGLSDEDAEFVYHLARDCEITTDKAAEFFEDWVLQIENGTDFGEYSVYEMAELGCKYNLSVSQTKEILHEIGCHGFVSHHDLPEGFFDIYFSEYNERFAGYDVAYICEILEVLEDMEMSVNEIGTVLDYCTILGVDPIDMIENYDHYIEEYDRACDRFSSFSLDDDGFGYNQSIWETEE